jgi:hypothetical protein
MKRCQVLADKVFDPGFLTATLGANTRVSATLDFRIDGE